MPFGDYSNFADCVADNQDKDEPEAFCAYLEYQTTGKWPAELSEEEQGTKSKTLTAPIVWKDEEKRIVYGPVLVPDEPDNDGDIVTAAKIESVAHNFLEKYRAIDVGHELFYGGVPIESYIALDEIAMAGARIPKGSWVMGVRVDEKQWPKVKSGELTGFSIMAVPSAEKGFSAKRVTLADLGPEWEVVAVSLVGNPAVPKAKWLAIKTDPKVQDPQVSLKDRVLQFLVSHKRGREISDRNYVVLQKAVDSLAEILERAKKERADKSSENEGDGNMPEEKESVDETPEGAGDATGNPPAPDSAPEGMMQEILKKSEVEAMISSAVEKLKEEITASLEEALKNVNPSIKSTSDQIRGQDGHSTGKAGFTPSRDPWGRKRKVD